MNKDNRNMLQAHYETGALSEEALFKDEALLFRKALLPALTPRLVGKVLCAGWSTTLMPTPPGASDFVVVDFAAAPLKAVPKRPNVKPIMADLERLPFDIGTFDAILVPNLLSQLAGDSAAETDTAVAAILKELARVMKGDGTMYFIEPMMNPIVETLNRALYPLLNMAMSRMGRPARVYYSLSSMKEILFDAKLKCVAEPINIPDKIGVFGFLPNLRLPASALPWKHYLIHARKRAAG